MDIYDYQGTTFWVKFLQKGAYADSVVTFVNSHRPIRKFYTPYVVLLLYHLTVMLSPMFTVK